MRAQGTTITLKIRFRQAMRTMAPLLLGLTLFTGCTSTVVLTKPVRESIRSVSINKNVKVPDRVLYHDPVGGGSLDLIGIGLLATAAAASGADQAAGRWPGAQIEAAMTGNQIDLGQIVREQFASELAEANVFPSIVSEDGDAEFRLEVLGFGFAKPPTLSLQARRPQLAIMGRLVGTNGTILWQESDDVRAWNSETPMHTLEEYSQNPQYVREAITSAAKIVSKRLVKHMLQD